MADDFDGPGLGVGFAISPDYSGLDRASAVMTGATDRIVAEAAKVEQATGGMLNLSGATAEVKTFGNAYDREMDKVARSQKSAERAGEAMVRQLDRQITTFGKTSAEIRTMRAEVRAVAAESNGLTELAGRIRAASSEMGRLERSTVSVGGTSRLAGHHVQNLAFQFQDLGIQMFAAAGSSAPLKMAFTALLQQGAQINGIMGQAKIGIRGVAAEFLAMSRAVLVAAITNPILLGIAAAATTAYVAFKLLQGSIARSADMDAYAKAAGLTKDELEKLGSTGLTVGDVFTGLWRTFDQITGVGAIFSSLKDTVTGAFADMGKATGNAVALIYGAHVGAYDSIVATWRLLPSAMGDLFVQAVNASIRAVNTLIERATAGLNWAITAANNAINALGGTARISTVTASTIGEMTNTWQGAAAKAGTVAGDAFYKGTQRGISQANAFGKQIYDNIIGANRDRVKSRIAEIIDDRTDKSVGGAARSAKTAVDELSRALDNILSRFDPAKVAARDFAKTLADIDKLLDAGMIKSADAFGYRIMAAREAAEADTKRLTDQINKGLGYTIGGADDPIEKSIKAMLGAGDAAKKMGFEVREAMDADQARRFAEELERLPNILAEINPALGAMAGLVSGLQTGNFSAVPGKAGAILQLVDGKVGKDGWKTITTKLDEIFTGGNGTFAQTMNGLMKSAGIGVGASSLILGGNSNSLGAAIGGAMGEKVGEKFFTKALGDLGDFAGPLGSIVGGVLGGLVGGLFKKTNWGSAVITGAGADGISATGSNSGRASGASALAGGVRDGLDQIASQLGGILGSFNVSIGTYKDNFRVSTTGSSKMGGYSGSAAQNEAKYGLYDFGDDQGAAIAFAIMDAIQDGAITGLREGTQRLLKAGSDIEAQLSKALSFQGVFDDLEQRLDPTGFALGNLEKSMQKLQAVFAEAGATAEEYAQLEQLIALQRKDVLDAAAARDLEALNSRRSLEVRLLEAQGDALGALALSRQIELSQTDESLRALLSQVYAAEDAASVMTGAASEVAKAAADAAADIASERMALQRQLLDLQGNTAAIRALDLAKLDESNRGLQNQIWALQDAKVAADAAEQLRKAWTSVGDTIIEEVMRIRGLTTTSSDAGFAVLNSQFNVATARARTGDQEAAGELVGLSQSMLAAAASVATSRQELARVQAQTAASLEQTYAAISGLTSTSTSSEAAILAAAATTASANGANNDNSMFDLKAALEEMRAEMAAMRADNNAGMAAVAGNTGAMKRHLDNVTAASGGDAIAIVTAA